MAAVELFFIFSFSLNPALVLTARFVLHSLTLVHFHFVSHVFGLVSSYKHRHVWGNFWCRPRIPHRANCEGVKHEGRQKVNVEVDSSPHTSTALSQRPDDLRYWNTIQFFIFQLFPFGASHPVRCEDAHQPSSFPPARIIFLCRVLASLWCPYFRATCCSSNTQSNVWCLTVHSIIIIQVIHLFHNKGESK